MGDSSGLGPDDVIAFVDAPEQHVAEVNRPDAVVDLLEADRVLLERVGEEEQSLLQANRAGVGDALDEEVPGVLARRQGAGVRPRRRPIESGRGPIRQRFVWPLVVIETPERVERPLLSGPARARRPTRLALEGLVHPFVGAVLLRV